MDIKKLLLFAISFAVFSLSLSSCSFFSKRNIRSNKKIAETRLQEIIEALENKDKEELKNMFSSNALKEANDIDGGMEYLMEFYKGKVISIEGSREGTESNHHGEKKSELKCFFRVTTNVDKYIVFFIDQLVDTKEPDNVGLYMLQIIKLSDRENEFDWGGGKSRCTGIYRPSEVENK